MSRRQSLTGGLVGGIAAVAIMLAAPAALAAHRTHHVRGAKRAATATRHRLRGLTPQAIAAPSGITPAQPTSATACALPDGTFRNCLHCYTPQDIRSAYGVDQVAPVGGAPNYG